MTIDFGLLPTGTDNPPAFFTPVACQDWLASVPMANAGQAQGMFLRQLNLLHRFQLSAVDRFELLETLRETVGDMQDDVAKKFAGRPLPLTPPEQAALEGTLAVWQALLNGYLRCLAATVAKEPGLDALKATIAQRTLSIFANWQVDLCRGQQLPDAKFWQTLHQVFSTAEAMGVAQQAVDDHSRHGNTQTTPLGAYGEVHLVHMASPFELPQRHLNWIARWAKRWGTKLGLSKVPPKDVATSARPIFVDLTSDRPASYTSHSGGDGRWLDTTELRRSLKTRLVMLEKGEQLSRMHLGEDCTQPAAGQLLQRVYQRWCKGGAPRRQERKPASGGCEFIAGLDAVHYYLSGRKPFRPPIRDDAMLRREREEMETFGTRATHHDENFSLQQGYQVENWAIIDDWQLLDQSASGLRLSRPLKAGARIGNGQMIAVKLAGSAQFVTGNVRWALHDKNDSGGASLVAGIQLFPGIATPISIRGADPGLRENFRQGLLLPEVAPLNEPASVIIPVGTFRVSRPIEILHDNKTRTLTLEKVLDRGGEFERCTFSAR
jgi:hypothetical protein